MLQRMLRKVASLATALACMVSTVAPAGAALAATGTTVTLQPSASTVAVGQEFTVGVVINNYTSLAGVTFELTYDPARLQVVDANGDESDGIQLEEGTIFAGKNPTVTNNEADNTSGSAIYNVLVTQKTKAVSGTSGTVATARFRALAAGPVSIGFKQDSAVGTGGLVLGGWNDSGQFTIDATTAPLTLDILSGTPLALARPAEVAQEEQDATGGLIWYTRASGLTINGKTASGASVTAAVGGGAPQALTPDGTGNFSFTLPLPADGRSAVTFTAALGSLPAATKVITVVRDTQAPTLTVTAEQALGPGQPARPLGPAADAAAGPVTLRVSASEAVGALTVGARLGTADLAVTPNPDGTYTLAIAPGQDGTVTVTVAGADKAGNPATGSFTFNADTTPPVLGTDVAVERPYTNQDRVRVTGSVTGATAIQFHTFKLPIGQGSPPVQSAGTINGGSFSGDALLTQGDGQYEIHPVAQDNALNYDYKTVTVVRDSVPPAVTITAPAANALFGAGTVTVKGELGLAADQLSPVASVTVNGAPATVATDPGTGKLVFTGAATLANTLADGAAVPIRVVARDEAGNEGTATVTITYTTQVTPLTLNLPAGVNARTDAAGVEHWYTNAGDLTITGTAGSTASAAAVTLKVGAGAPAPVTVGPDGRFSASVTLQAGAATELTFTATSNLASAVKTVVVHQDSVLPEITVPVSVTRAGGEVPLGDQALARGGETVTIRVVASEELAGAPAVTLAGIAGLPAPSAPVQDRGAYLYTVALPAGANGIVTVTVTGQDLAGNTGSTTRTFGVDSVEPVLNISAPASPTRAAEVTFTFTVQEDNLSAVFVGTEPLTAVDGVYTVRKPLQEGSNTFAIAAVDRAGNSATRQVTVVSDRTGPTVSPTTLTPAAGATIGSKRPPFQIPVTDALTPVHVASATLSLQVTPEGGAARTVTVPLAAGTTANDGKAVVLTGTPAEDLAAAESTATVAATLTVSDAVGNTTTFSAWSFTINTRVPRVTATARDASGAALVPNAAGWLNRAAQVTLEASAPAAIQYALVQRAAMPPQPADFPPYTAPIAVGDGEWDLYAFATDNVTGLTGDPLRVATYRVDTRAPQAPAALATDPAGRTWLKGGDTVTMRLTAEAGLAATWSLAYEQQGPDGQWAPGAPLTGAFTGEGTDYAGQAVIPATAGNLQNLKLTIRLEDQAGNVTTVTRDLPYRVDTVPPQVGAVTHSATRPLRAGERLEVTLTGEAGLRATGTLTYLDPATGSPLAGVAPVEFTLAEGAPGTYTFAYTVPDEDADRLVAVAAVLTDLAGNATPGAAVSRVAFDTTLPAVTSVSLDSPARQDPQGVAHFKAGDTIRIRVAAEPGLGKAAGSLKGVAVRLPLTAGPAVIELTEELDGQGRGTGVYTGGYTVQPGDSTQSQANRSGQVKLTAAVVDAAGNLATLDSTARLVVDTTAPRVFGIGTTAAGILREQSSFDLIGAAEPGLKAVRYSFTTGRGEQSGAMADTAATPGFYKATYQVQPGDDTAGASVSIVFTDWADNVTTLTIDQPEKQIRIDTTAPQIGAIALKKNGQPLAAGSLLKAGDTLEISFQSEPGLRATASVTGIVSGAPMEAGADGTYTLRLPVRSGMNVANADVAVQAADAAGHTSTQAVPAAVTVDTLPPQASARISHEPRGLNGWYVLGPTLTFQVEAGATLTVTDNGQPVTLGAPVTADGLDTYTWAVPDGRHTVSFQAADAAGNQSPLRTLPEIKVDTRAPAAPVLQTTATSPTSARTVTITGTAGSDVTRVALYANGEFRRFAPVTEGTFTFADVRLVEDLNNRGVNRFTARAVDEAGNQSDLSAPLEVTRDTTPPSIGIELTQTTAADGQVAITVSEPLNAAGLSTDGSSVTLTPANPTTTTNAQGQTVYHFTYTGATGSEIKIKASGTDLAGNTGHGRLVQTRINPARGGTAESADGAVQAQFGSGVLQGTADQQVDVTITSYVAENLTAFVPRGTQILGSAYDFKAKLNGLDALRAGAAVDVTFKVILQGQVPSRVGIYYFPLQLGGLPELVFGDVIDQVANGDGTTTVTIRAQLPHFSIWAPFADETGPAFVGTVRVNGADAALTPAVKTDAAGKVRVSGTVDGSAVKVQAKVNDTVVASQTWAEVQATDRNFALEVPVSGDGLKTVRVEALDQFNNPSTLDISFTLDTTAPALTAADVTVNGAAYTGKVFTGAATATVSASSAGALLTVTQTVGGTTTTLATDTADGFSLTPNLPANQDVTLTITARDTALDVNGNPTGNLSAPVTVLLRRDTAAPEIALTGLNSGTTVTPARTLTVGYDVKQLGGTAAEDVASVSLTLSGGGTASAFDGTRAAQGGITLTFPADGTYTVTVTAVDRAGNTAQVTRTVVVDGNVPAVSVTAAEPATRQNTVAITVQAREGTPSLAGAAIAISVNGAPQALDPAVIGETGTYTYTAALTREGANTIDVQVTGGNGLTGSASVTVVRDTTPSALNVTPPAATTTGSSVTITGTAEAGARISASGGAATATAEAAADGSFSLTVQLNVGANTITVTAADAVGNITEAPAFTVTRSVPAAPIAVTPVLPTISLTAAAGVTRQSSVDLTGTTAPYAAVVIRKGSQQLATLTAGADGRFTYAAALAEGENTFTAVATTGSGSASATITVVRDTTAPALSARVEQDVVNTASLAVPVTAEKGARILVDGQAAGTAGADGKLTITLQLQEGQNRFTLKAVDPAGNESGTVTLAVVLDTVAPTLAVSGPRQPVAEEAAELTVRTEAGAAVLVNGQAAGTAGADGSLTVTVPLAPGENRFTLVARDRAGNLSGESKLTLKRSPAGQAAVKLDPLPNLATAAVFSITGQASPNARVEIELNGRSLPAVTARANGRFEALVTLAEGANRIAVTVRSGGTTATDRVTVRVPAAAAPAPVDLVQHWAAADVQTLVAAGVLSGFEDGTFRPDLPVTRAQFARMVVSALGLEVPAGERTAFADTDRIPEWAKGYIAVAVRAGLIAGFEDQTFRADLPITRAQMAIILSRALKLKGIAARSEARAFADRAEIPAWALEAIDTAAAAGLISGFEDQTFRPGGVTTRAQAAVVIRRLMDAR